MAVGVQQAFSVTAASNATADTNINYAEGQTPASLNNSARAEMAAIKGFANQITGAKTSGGSANAQTFTSDSVAAITSYAAGRLFCFKAGYTNSTTTPTFNVDGVGAKTIKKGGAQAALAVGDITAGGIYWLAYEASGDCFLLLNPESGAISGQPLDATLTALAALSWSSGNALLQFTAADTVSLTLTPSVSSISTSQGAAATTPSATFVNTTDNASVRVLRLEGDRATPAANDETYVSFYLSDSAGTQEEFVRITARATTVSNGTEASSLRFGLRTGGAAVADLFGMQPNNLFPVTNATVALGGTSNSWTGLFLASTATINFSSSNVVLTHSTGLLSVTTGDFQANLPLSTETTGTLTVASANKHILATGGITLPNSVFAARNITTIDGNGTSRTITRGSGVTMYVNGTDSATATLTSNGLMAVYWRTASICILKGDVS